MFIKKLYLVHYGLTHIALPKILYKFPPKAHFFLEFKNLFKKLYQGQYGLTHIVCKWEHLKEAISKRKIFSIRKKSY